MTKEQLEAIADSLNETNDTVTKMMKADRRYNTPEHNAAALIIVALANAASAAAKVTPK